MGQQVPAGKTIQKTPEAVCFHCVLARGNQALQLLGVFSGEMFTPISF
jgi:hypothetical protein